MAAVCEEVEAAMHTPARVVRRTNRDFKNWWCRWSHITVPYPANKKNTPEGLPLNKTRKRKRCQRPQERCKFSVVLRPTPNGPCLTTVHLEHNHPTTRPPKRRRCLKPGSDDALRAEIEDEFRLCADEHLSARQALRLSKKREQGTPKGELLATYTLKEVANVYHKHGNTLATDCKDFLATLESQRASDPDFFLAFRVDPNTRVLTHCFWMTGYQKRLALRFGSLVIHDNTYKSNLWLYHLGLFTVVNEHGVSMIAAQALTLRETEEDYIFQYTQWLKAVGFLWGIIYTDCAIAVLNAVAFIVNAVGGTGGNHFWCRWHMVQAMIRNLKAGWWQQHERAFYWCVYQADPTTFELAWGLFLAGQKPKDREYLSNTWGGDKTKRWAACYQMHAMTLLVQSTQRTEGLNRWCKTKTKASGTLMRLHSCMTRCLEVQHENRAISSTNDETFDLQHFNVTVGGANGIFGLPWSALQGIVTAFACRHVAMQMVAALSLKVVCVTEAEVKDNADPVKRLEEQRKVGGGGHSLVPNHTGHALKHSKPPTPKTFAYMSVMTSKATHTLTKYVSALPSGRS